jgi:hypothetical protein
MAKLVFPSANAPYRGFVGEVRGWLNRIASYVQNSPQAAPILSEHISALISQTSLTVVLPDGVGVVADGQTFPVEGGTVTVSVTGNTVSLEFDAE